ncbi:MAG: gliding motility-associated C-terminal domain-containing protein, partial [Cyclobacteriaceae bacterium]|nr:gliding motility-associated C-terminal domain-containing protein [Cyclobacteriaceae bacterium]
PGTYTCTITNADGCFTTENIVVSEVSCSIQKGISPKGVGPGDGLNDSFDLSTLNVSKLEIFNRYGSKVYSKDNYTNEWFGQSDAGNELPDGTYYYVIKLVNDPTQTGWIYINREQ